MADFLSPQWFETLNDQLKVAGSVPMGTGPAIFRVVFEFSDAAASLPHAMTFSLSSDGASVEPGDHLMADTVIRMATADANAIFEGTSDSAEVLRQGKIKVRGDVTLLVPLTSWLQNAHPHNTAE